MVFLNDLKMAVRSLARARALWITVTITLALGIGANAAIFSIVRGVLLRPLVNRDEDRLLYVRQSAPGLGTDDVAFSIPEIKDIGSGLKTIRELGTFSSIDFTMEGIGEPREVKAGVVDGNYFEVMGLKPIVGRLLNAGDDGQGAAGAAVLTYRFWTNSMNSDASVIGKTIRLGSDEQTRVATIVGVLEPSIPYPVATELISNVVTSPASSFGHHGAGPRAPHDRSVCPAGSRSDPGLCRRRTANRLCHHVVAASGDLPAAGPLPDRSHPHA